MAKNPRDQKEGVRQPQAPHGPSPKIGLANRRRRIIAGTVRAVAIHGFGRITVAQILEGVGVSRRAFYEQFPDAQAAVEAAEKEAWDALGGVVSSAFEEQDEWPLKVKAALGAGLRFAAASPEQARLLARHSTLSTEVLGRSDCLTAGLAAGRAVGANDRLPPVLEQALIGGIASLVREYVARGEAGRLPELESEMLRLLLRPYLGAVEADRIAGIPTTPT